MITDSAVFETLKYRVEVDDVGTRRYYNSAGDLHRDEGPAVEYVDKSKQWYQTGLCHRDVGPAFITARGTRKWAINGRLHRTDGPAIEWSNGGREWWINGVEYTKNEYHLQLKLQGHTS
jgi:hypothetical protein